MWKRKQKEISFESYQYLLFDRFSVTIRLRNYVYIPLKIHYHFPVPSYIDIFPQSFYNKFLEIPLGYRLNFDR